jgi:hypothetical protein
MADPADLRYLLLATLPRPARAAHILGSASKDIEQVLYLALGIS